MKERAETERGAGRGPVVQGGEPSPTEAATVPLSEATLATLWEGQRFPPEALRLTDGRKLRVVYRGRRSGGPGPDFRDAVLSIDPQGLRYGDIELHARPADWWAHGHQRDPAYAGVILHVVFEPPKPGEALPVDRAGRPIPTVALGPWAVRRAGELAAWLAGPPHWREPCHDALAILGETELRKILERLGLRRLREKAAGLGMLLDRPGAPAAEALLHVAIYEALGYPRNRDPFRRLAAIWPWSRLRAELLPATGVEQGERAEALLLAAAGLLTVGGAVAERRRASLLQIAAGAGSLPVLMAAAWQRTGLRPAYGGPERRVAGAAALAARFAAEGLLASLERAAQLSTDDLLAVLTVESDPVWGRGALIGRGRAIEIATNAVLPLLLALAERLGQRARARLWEERFLALPRAEPYGRTAALERAIAAGGRTLVRGVPGQQALLYLQEHYCSRGKCGRCPLS